MVLMCIFHRDEMRRWHSVSHIESADSFFYKYKELSNQRGESLSIPPAYRYHQVEALLLRVFSK